MALYSHLVTLIPDWSLSTAVEEISEVSNSYLLQSTKKIYWGTVFWKIGIIINSVEMKLYVSECSGQSYKGSTIVKFWL